jgi:hypothetical protein
MNEFIELGRLSGRAVAAVVAGAPGLHTQFTENCAVVFSGEPHPAMNMIFASPGADTEDVLMTSAALALRRGHPALALVTQEAPAEGAALASCWYAPAGQMPLMVLGKDALPGAAHICELVAAITDPLASRAIALRSEGRYSIESMTKTVNPSMIVDPAVEIYVGISNGAAAVHLPSPPMAAQPASGSWRPQSLSDAKASAVRCSVRQSLCIETAESKGST